MGKIRYVVEAVDVDGDGIPDGDLVKKFNGNKLISQKFVAAREMKKIANVAKQRVVAQQAVAPRQPKQKIIYRTAPVVSAENKPVIVQQQTNLGEYLKMGFGVGVGAEVGKRGVYTVFSGLSSLF